MESPDIEIRREKVFVPQNMSVKEISEKYGVCPSTANLSQKRGWLIKNYSRKQVFIDRNIFTDPVHIASPAMSISKIFLIIQLPSP